MYCQKCGNEIPDNSVFCDVCGERVSFYSKTKPAQKKDTISIMSPMDTINEDDSMLSMLPETERKRVLKWYKYLRVFYTMGRLSHFLPKIL